MDLQRRVEHGAIGYIGAAHFNVDLPVAQTAARLAAQVADARQQLPGLPAEVAPFDLHPRLIRLLQRNIQRQPFDGALRLQRAPVFEQRRRQRREERHQRRDAVQHQLRRPDPHFALMFRAEQLFILRTPQQREVPCRPRLAVGAEARLRHADHPAVLIAREVRSQAVDLQVMRALFALPVRAALAQQQIACVELAFTQADPGRQAKPRAVEPRIVAHPAPQPRPHVDVVRLHPDAAVVE